MPGYYIGIDVGTTAIKGALLDEAREIVARARQEQRQFSTILAELSRIRTICSTAW